MHSAGSVEAVPADGIFSQGVKPPIGFRIFDPDGVLSWDATRGSVVHLRACQGNLTLGRT